MYALSTLRRVGLLFCAAALSACVATRPLPTTLVAWPERVAALQEMSRWSVQARAAAAVGTQGWQASLNWNQRGNDSELHLSGPLGMGATLVRLTPSGLSLNDGPPSPDVVAQLQERLGFELPLASLRYWLLGIPDPASTSEVTRNAADRAGQLAQGGWTVDIDRYLPVAGDLLPGHLVLQRNDVRVRLAVDHWDFAP